ncbi:helix-turn-helix domain-containing protein [Mesohalobacter halotolerans]|uniref:Transcriptional regulator n=1 Tax=Mesohalobacter halotolerans TaxID=1883405 RepID=A0A4U5TTN6_9FLAO|nr:helix-turn-helix domain-containing protein [Mesohalobacter halotolerans]MBS3739671.1 helix-turn-helix domain-containing protein [Psychroflexus sp.]TKS56648.1 transcriptional regulator [Mesohalobacter halotolerans]
MNTEVLKYTVIHNQEQYNEYCDILEELVVSESNQEDEIELLNLLIEKWDQTQFSREDLDPIQSLKALMSENNLRAKDLISILNLSKGTISKILNYQKGLSKESIRKLADYFKISQVVFNRPYKLKNN